MKPKNLQISKSRIFFAVFISITILFGMQGVTRGQTFQLVSENFNSIDVFNFSTPTFTDLDGDALLDMIIGEVLGNLHHYEQDAINSTSFTLVTENFSSIIVVAGGGGFPSPTFTDLDGDALLDLIIGEKDGNVHHYEQDAINSTSFTLVTETFISIDIGSFSYPTFTDLDGDAMLDLIIGESDGNLNHYEQDAINSTSFTLVTETFNSIDIGERSTPTFTDLDGDGLLDLIIGEHDGTLYHYEQTAIHSTSFSLVTSNFNSIDVGDRSTPTLTDLDGDALLDLIIGELDGNLNHYEQEADEDAIDIGIYATSCSDFEVRLKSDNAITGTNLTNVQFAVKYPASVTLGDITYPYPVGLQYTTIVGADKYSVFIGVDVPLNNWVAGTEYTVLTFSIDHATAETIDLIIGDDAWTTANNAVYYAELLGLDNTGSIYAGGTVNLRVNNTTQGTYYCTIQQAVDDANTGDAISVATGIFYEEVSISGIDNLTITGAGEANTLIAPYRNYTSNNYGLSIDDADGITIQNLTIDGFANTSLTPGVAHFKDGVHWGNIGGNDCIITHVTVNNVDRRGISTWPETVTNNEISYCTVNNVTGVNQPYGHGIKFNGSGKVENCDISNITGGILGNINIAGTVSIQNNVIYDITGATTTPFDIGLNFWCKQSNDITIKNNQITANVDDNNGIYVVRGGDGSEISGNIINLTGDGGCAIETGWANAWGFPVHTNTITMGKGGTGILITGAGTDTDPMLIYNNDLSNVGSDDLFNNDYSGSYSLREVGLLLSGSRFTSRSGDADDPFFGNVYNNTVDGFKDGIVLISDPYDAGGFNQIEILFSDENSFTNYEKAARYGYDVGAFVEIDINDPNYLEQDLSLNYWGSATPDFVNVIDGKIEYCQFYTDAGFTTLSCPPVTNIDLGTRYFTIQSAIDDPLTLTGHTIEAAAGTYNENVVINKALLTVKSASSPAIIDGGGSGTVVTITANGVNLEGFTVQNSGTAPTDLGVQLYLVGGCTVEGNTLINNANGLFVIYGTGNFITSNIVNTNTYYGVGMAASTGNTINLNNISANGLDAIALDNGDAVGGDINDGSTGNFIIGNTISSNRDGIFFGENCDDNNVTDINQITATNRGISFWRSGGHTITDNTISSTGSGIHFLGSSDNTITGNTITGNDIGLEIDASWQVGVWYPSLNNTISENNISSNTSFGVDATENQNSVVDASSNWWGDATGPYRSPDNTCGLGNAVSDNVTICDWYTDIAMTPADLNGCVVLAFNVTGGGEYCDGGIGVSIGLSGSEVDVNYALYNGASLISTLPGTGSSLDFGLQTVGGTYTVLATNTITGCADILMNSNAIVTVNPLPDAPTAGNISTTYNGLLHTGTATAPSGSSVVWYDAATGGSITVAPSGTDVGTYTAWAESEDDITGCISTTRTQVTVTITLAPLTITANNDTKVYDGLAYSGGNGVVYDGFVNGETSAVLSGTLTYGGTSQGAINTGAYAITPGGLTSTNYFITFVDGELTITPVTLGLKVLLQGPYAGGGLMNTDLNPTQLPNGQPFNVAPWNYAGTETLPGALTTEVDWVLVELRSDASTMVGRAAGLVHSDGTVSLSVNDVSFPGVVAGSDYYIVIWHRNHMPVMSASAQTAPVAAYDYTVESNLYGTDAAIDLGSSTFGMIAGDVTHNGELKYSGPGNDRGPIIARIVAETGSNNTNGFTPAGYWQEDASLNSIVLYLGTANDRAYIVDNLAVLTGTPYLNNTYTSVVPGAYTGSKDGSNDGPVDIQFAETAEIFAIEIVTNEMIEDGMVDNVQFTLAWKAGDYEIEEMLNTFSSSFNLLPQGDVVQVDDINYLTFVSVTLTNLPEVWNNGENIAIGTLEKEYGQVIGDRLWIADDDYTLSNNGEYYVSNWGSDITGIIYTSTVGIGTENAGIVKMYPNPVISDKLFLQTNTTQVENLETQIWDISGKLIKKFEYQTVNGTMTHTIDVSELNTGVYLIHVIGNNVLYKDRFIVK